MKQEYTRIVTDRAHNLLSTGIWGFWIDFGSWRKELLSSDRFAASETVPLTIKHDGIYFAFLLRERSDIMLSQFWDILAHPPTLLAHVIIP